jgi:DNA-binding MarR family transcriptional regulator
MGFTSVNWLRVRSRTLSTARNTKIVRRVVDGADKRCTRIVLTEPVKDYLEKTAPLIRVGPLVGALQRASADERQTILAGLSTLRRLLGGNNQTSEQDRSSEA